MIFQNKDGELRIIEHGNTGTTYCIEILFADANLSGPVSRAQTEERLILDRGILDAQAHYVEGGDAARLEPLPLTFSTRTADTTHTQNLLSMMSGATTLSTGGSAYIMYSRKGKGINIYGLSTSLPAFADDGVTGKVAYMVEVLYSGTSSWGFRWDEVYFPPAEQTITEAEDSLTLNLNGQIYGGVTKITAFTTATKLPD